MPHDDVDLVRSRVDIVELVSQGGVLLKRTGKTWKGLCPFHDDRNPSFTVDPTIGRYKCWSCGAAGDVFTWVMSTQKVDFPEALRQLAQLAGVEIKGRSRKDSSERENYERAMGEALSFFRAEFAKSKEARDYCEGRGLGPDIVDAWEIGYAPRVDEALPMHLQKQGVPLAPCVDVYLLDRDAAGGYFSRFRGRLMFPIRDARGQLVAFGGRIIGDGQPKYINSSDTPLFSKRRVLYGFDRARDAIAASKRAVLVEGYLDVIACHRAGVKEAVASLGTSMSEEHAKLLARWCERVVVLYDADRAGQQAAERAAELLRAEKLSVRIALMPPGSDPDTMLRNQGAEALKAAAAGGMSPLGFRMRQLEASLAPEDEAYWAEAVAALSESDSHLEVDRYVVELAGRYPGLRDPKAAQRTLWRMVQAARRSRGVAGGGQVAVQMPAAAKVAASERVLLVGLFGEEAESAWMALVEDVDRLVSPIARDVAEALRGLGQKPPGPPGEWLPRVEPEELRENLAEYGFDQTTIVNADAIAGAVADLERRRELAELHVARQQASGDDELRAIQVRLERLKGVPPAAEGSPEQKS